jgi:hypothetical protein
MLGILCLRTKCRVLAVLSSSILLFSSGFCQNATSVSLRDLRIIKVSEAWTLYRSYRWPELRDLREDPQFQGLAHKLNATRSIGPEPCDTFRVRGYGSFASPYLRSTYHFLYVSKGSAALSMPPGICVARVDSLGVVNFLDPEIAKSGPRLGPQERMKANAQQLNEDFLANSFDSIGAVSVAVDIIALLEDCYPQIILDSLQDISAYSKSVVSDDLWNQAELDDSALALVSTIHIFHVSENRYFDAIDYEETGTWYELELPARNAYNVSPPRSSRTGDVWRTELFVWSPSGGILVKWVVSLKDGAGFDYERTVLAESLGFIFGQ